jgi:hypothetical protein
LGTSGSWSLGTSDERKLELGNERKRHLQGIEKANPHMSIDRESEFC